MLIFWKGIGFSGIFQNLEDNSRQCQYSFWVNGTTVFPPRSPPLVLGLVQSHHSERSSLVPVGMGSLDPPTGPSKMLHSRPLLLQQEKLWVRLRFLSRRGGATKNVTEKMNHMSVAQTHFLRETGHLPSNPTTRNGTSVLNACSIRSNDLYITRGNQWNNWNQVGHGWKGLWKWISSSW